MSSTKEKIAVLGGGVGAMTAVFELTEQPNWQERYEITVYQLGWRLGGRGASGRMGLPPPTQADQPAATTTGSATNERRASQSTRPEPIEEHGLHLWFGFYENAFNIMRRCLQAYRALPEYDDSPIRSIEQAFRHQSGYLYTTYHPKTEQYREWPFPFPVQLDEYPGLSDPSFTLVDAFHHLLGTVNAALLKVEAWFKQADIHITLAPHLLALLTPEALQHDTMNLAQLIMAALKAAGHGIAAQLGTTLSTLLQSIEPDKLNAPTRAWIVEQTGNLLTWLHHLHEDSVHEQDIHHSLITASIGVGVIRGLIADEIPLDIDGFLSMNAEEYQAWFKRHGVEEDVWNSAPLTGLYNIGFCFTGGDPEQANRIFAAGTALYGMFRMSFTYRGAAFFKMTAGMGDIVFAPLYAVLKARGVQFKFFHRVTNLGLTGDRSQITRIEIARQATLKTDSYDPLTRAANRLPVWPNEPLYDQLVEGETLRTRGINLESYWADWQDPEPNLTLRLHQDFDTVLFGISLGAIPVVAQELIQASSRWADLVHNVPTVFTQQYEFWLTRPITPRAGPGNGPLVFPFAQPGDAWTNMDHLLPQENWGPNGPRGLVYFGAALETPPADQLPPRTEHDYPARMRARAQANLKDYLDAAAKLYWPDDPVFRWEDLYDPENRVGPARLAAQGIRANINPSDRHPLTPAESSRYRIPPGNTGFTNLVIAGDWTNVGILSFGFVECAAISGRLAARAICGQPDHYLGEP